MAVPGPSVTLEVFAAAVGRSADHPNFGDVMAKSVEIPDPDAAHIGDDHPVKRPGMADEAIGIWEPAAENMCWK